MTEHDVAVAKLRQSPEFAMKTADEQYETQRETLLQSLFLNPEFRSGPIEFQKAIIEEQMSEFSPVYENPQAGAWVEGISGAYLQGDRAARDTMQMFYEKTDINDRLPIITSLFKRAQDPLDYYKIAGGYERFSDSPMALNRTRGADDNKARIAIANTFRKAGDPEMIAMLDSKKRDRIVTAARVAEEVAIALIGGAAGGLVGGAAKGAQALQTAGRAGSFLANHLPQWAMEAGVEGLRGSADYLNQVANQGDDPTFGGAAIAFGAHAAVDFAIGAVADGIFSIIGAAKYGYDPEVANELVKQYGNSVATGAKAATDIKLPSSLDPEHFRALSSINMKNQSLAKLSDGVTRMQDLTELEQANLKAYQQSYYLTKSSDGSIVVQSKNNPSKALPFNNTLEAEEWMGSQGSKHLDNLVKAGDTEAAASFIANNPQLNYKLAREADDLAWVIPDAPEKFVNIPARQYVNPVEMADFTGKHQNVVKFNTVVPDEKLKKGGIIYGPKDHTNITYDPNGNSAYFFNDPSKIASLDEVKVANAIADKRLKDPTMGNGVTREAIIRDELVKAGKELYHNPDGSLTLLFPDKIKITNRFINPETGKVGQLPAGQKPFGASVKITAGLDPTDMAFSPKMYAQLGVRLMSGDINVKQIKRYAEGYLKSKGKDSVVTVTTNNTNTIKLGRTAKGNVTVSIPASITDPKLQREMYAKLIRGLDSTAGVTNIGSPSASYIKQFNTQQKNYIKMFYSVEDFDKYAKTLQGIPSVLEVGKKDGKYFFKSVKTGKIYDSLDPNMLLRDVAVNEMDSATFAKALRNGGYDVLETKEGFTISTPGSKEFITSGADQVEIAKQLDFYPEKLPKTMAPAHTMISEVPGINLEATRQFASGTAPEIAQFMGNFEDASKVLGAEVFVKKVNGDRMLKLGKANYEVYISGLKYTRKFDNAKDARAFLEGEWKTIQSAQEAARDKGLRMYYADGKFNLVNGETTLTADTVDELRAHIAQAPNPTYASEIIPEDLRQALFDMNIELELPPGFGRMSLSGTEMNPAPKDFKAFTDTTPGFFNKYGPKIASLRRIAVSIDARTGGKLNLAAGFEKLHKNTRIGMAKTFEDTDYLFNIFKEGKIMISADRRKGITHLIEAGSKTADEKAKVIKQWKLTDYDINVIAPKLKEYYVRKGDELGIPFERLLNDYQPLLRKESVNFKEATDTMLMTNDYMISNPKLKPLINQRGFEFYNLFERYADFRSTSMEEDALALALRYTSAGNRHFYAGRSWDAMYQMVKENNKLIEGDGYITLLNGYKDAVTHPQNVFHTSSVTKSLNGMAKKLGMQGESATAFVDMMISLPYMSSMAFRPWLVFRNLFQVYTILPLRTGNIYTPVKATVQFMKNPKAVLKEMLDEGVITKLSSSQPQEYMEMMKGQIAGTKGPVRRFYEAALELGLHPYGQSDDWTRAISYLASKDMFNKGLKKGMQGGKLMEGAFMKASRSDGLMPPVQEEVLRYMREGNLRAAETTMARANIDATMFDYTAMNKPLGASGTLGHLFYQFGTYSINYTQSLATNLAHGSMGNKISGFVAMAAGMAIVSQAMKAAGVENSEFLGYNSVLFNGGPFFQMTVDALGSIEPGVRGDLARKDFMRNFGLKPTASGIGLTYPALAPGYMGYKYYGKFKEAWAEGDYYGAWLAATTTPEHKSRNE